ncbi:MAG: PadR family transcriptional regulator [Armatimonadetes bacterium]|nr:PadR family transcriptional regulator [Armatimonadota bacterium]MDW8154330.1 PadR family transcriptional regulator [Armatimonadota bacterium]
MRERFFGRGALKYLVLDVLKDRPMHGYDVIRALQDRFGGFYTPSPGAVYPTLQMLEDMGYVTSAEHQGKRVYTITEEGRRFLEQGKEFLKGIEERFGAWRCHWAPAYRELWEFALLLRRSGLWGRAQPEQLRRVREIIARARREVEAILEGQGP